MWRDTRDGAAKGPKSVGFGNCWVVAGIVVGLPFLSRPVCLPVLARLWRPRRTGKIAYAREMVELMSPCSPIATKHLAAPHPDTLRDHRLRCGRANEVPRGYR